MVDVVDDTPLISLLRDIRRQQGEQRSLLLSLTEYARKLAQRLDQLEQRLDEVERRLDRRMVAVRDDLELMLKAELLGRLTHFEGRIDERLAELESGRH
jgi:molybdenum-dependent DNA-binding transcriptional regulator ModE